MAKHRVAEVVGTGGTLLVGSSEEGACLKAILVCKFAASGVCTVYNGQTASGTVVATIDCSTIDAQGTYEFDCYLDTGLFVAVTGGAARVSVVYY